MKTLVIMILFLFFQNSFFAQKNIDNQIKKIRKEYSYITSKLESFTKKETYISNDKHYGLNKTLRGYLNYKNEVVMLTYEVGEEGYGSEYQYYFKNNKLFFIYINSIDPEENKTQERIYFYNNKIIKALIKEIKYDNDLPLNRIPNKKHAQIIKDIDKSSEIWLNNAIEDKKLFLDAIMK